MIYGIGTDLVDNGRIAALYERHGTRLLRQILTATERAEFAENPKPAHVLAKRFAAKEAFAKAAGTGLRKPVAFNQMTITHDTLCKPGFVFGAELAAWLSARGIHRCHVSISDEVSMTCAFVTLESEPLIGAVE